MLLREAVKEQSNLNYILPKLLLDSPCLYTSGRKGAILSQKEQDFPESIHCMRKDIVSSHGFQLELQSLCDKKCNNCIYIETNDSGLIHVSMQKLFIIHYSYKGSCIGGAVLQ